MALPQCPGRNESPRKVISGKPGHFSRRARFRLRLFGLAALAGISLAAAAPADTRESPREIRLQAPGATIDALPSRSARSLVGEHALALERGSGLSYTRRLRFGQRSFEVRARGPLPRSAARRRFLGLQFELRF
ncbi:MAG: hypothetical protein HRU02_17145 [Myxococcales bacterium]|nr:hypothetical protein [Myxococcales bacterium]